MPQAFPSRLSTVSIAPVQSSRNMEVFPLVAESQDPPAYLLLSEALKKDFLQVEEISEHGSVPTLSAINTSDHLILILDGEEVAGAKQNRVLNTSALIAPRSKVTLPVSCTEQGRWHSSSRKFSDSGVMMARKLRTAKHRSVTESLKRGAGPKSDQHEVWQEIAALDKDAGTHSPSSAMKDTYTSREQQLKEFCDSFPTIEGQCGLAVRLDGRIEGVDLVSRSEAYEGLHDRLLRSYAIEALVTAHRHSSAPKTDPEDVATFLSSTEGAEVSEFPPVGVGSDLRIQSPSVQGATLEFEETAIHLSLFPNRESEAGPEAPRFSRSSVRRRRRHF